MSIELPPPIAAMLAATNQGDSAAFLASFTDDAFLSDWGRTFSGQEGVAQWNRTDNIGVQSRIAVSSIVQNGDVWTARVTVRGNGYNGEGIMAFTLRDGRIARLEIR